MKKYLVLLLLSFVLISCGKQENQPITTNEVPKVMEEVVVEDRVNLVVENNSISNTGEIIETGSGENIEKTIDYSEINNSAKIYDAYISDDTERFTDESYNNLFNKDELDKSSLLRLSGTAYFKDKNGIYCEPWCQFEQNNGINPNLFKGILPYKGFTGSSIFATEGKNIFYWGKKVENGDIKSLKFKVFGDGNIIASDKNNLYIGMKQIIPGKNIEYLEKLDNKCFKDNISIICNFFDGGGTMYRIIEGVDNESFTPFKKDIWQMWYKDNNNNVYYGGYKKENLDIKTFEILNDGQFAKDKYGVYYFGEKINGADITTFQILNLSNPKLLNGNTYSKDKNYIYKNGSIIEGINPNGFDLEKYLKEKESSN